MLKYFRKNYLNLISIKFTFEKDGIIKNSFLQNDIYFNYTQYIKQKKTQSMMMKNFKYLFVFLFFCFFSKGQTVIDSLVVNPNPFQKRTSCTYSFINTDTVSINVYNTIGNIIYSPIVNSIKASGVYQDSLIMDSYADGIYFVQLKLGHRKTISKRVLKSNTASINAYSKEPETGTIYPNPTKDNLNIAYSSTHCNKITIFDVTGKLCFNSEYQQEVDISHLQNGFYYLQLQTYYGNKIFKIIKN